jgi:hypothetical protein
VDIAQPFDALIFKPELRVHPSKCHCVTLLFRDARQSADFTGRLAPKTIGGEVPTVAGLLT